MAINSKTTMTDAAMPPASGCCFSMTERNTAGLIRLEAAEDKVAE